MKLDWKVMNPHTGQEMEEDAPLTSVSSGGIDLSPDAAIKKKKKKDNIFDGRTKAYREHRAKLEASRLRRQEALKKKNSNFVESVIEGLC
tara:strand:- start:1628 stop:1897 length:270 start_codon:yes stop_codon:yes gene_type:complete